MKFLFLMCLIIQAASLFAHHFTGFSTEVCRLPPIEGFCRAYIRRWFYDSRVGACKKFIYGGCGGNDNNFNTKEECESRCGAPVNPICTATNKYELPQGKNCAPGTVWKDQCNFCRCDQDGEGVVCTLMGCPEEETGGRMRCAPNSRWRNECNTCWCSANGEPICTLKSCGPFQLGLPAEHI